MIWSKEPDKVGGGGSTTKDIGNKNPSTKWSTTSSQVNNKYERIANKKGTTKQNSKNNKSMTSNTQNTTASPNQPVKATADIGNSNPANRVTTSPSSKTTATQVRTSGGDLALRARAAGKGGGGGRNMTRSVVASGRGFIKR